MNSIEQKLDRIIELLEQLVVKKPTPRKKTDSPKLQVSPQKFHSWLSDQCGCDIPYSSNHQFGWLGRKMRDASFPSSGDIAYFAEHIANEQFPWYKQNGHAFTMGTILKNFNRWLEQYRAGPIKATKKQEELRIK